MEHIPKVFMRLFQCRTQTRCTDIMHRRIYEFHTEELHRRLAEDQSVDSTSKVLVSVMTSASLSFEVKDYDISGKTHSDLTRACAEHNAELRKTNAALCRGKHHAALLYNPSQDVRMAMQEYGPDAELQEVKRDEQEFRTSQQQVKKTQARARRERSVIINEYESDKKISNEAILTTDVEKSFFERSKEGAG